MIDNFKVLGFARVGGVQGLVLECTSEGFVSSVVHIIIPSWALSFLDRSSFNTSRLKENWSGFGSLSAWGHTCAAFLQGPVDSSLGQSIT